MEISGYIALIFVGILLGVTGSGGSVLSVPVLVYFFALDVVQASAYSLFVVGISSVAGTFLKLKAQNIDLRVALTFGVPSVISIVATRAWLLPAIPEVVFASTWLFITKRDLILSIFSTLMMASAYMNIRGKRSTGKTGVLHSKKPDDLFLILLGIGTGLMSELAGIGGGFLIVPVLMYGAHLSFEKAVGTTLFIMTGNALTGFITHSWRADADWNFLLSITAVTVGGICFGILFLDPGTGNKVQKPFGWFCLITAIGILFTEIVL